MKTSNIIAAAALSLVAVMGTAQAEQYQGVTTVNSAVSRADTQQQAFAAAARQANAYEQDANNYRNSPLTSAVDRATVQAGAVAAAHDGTSNLVRGAFVNSQIPAAYTQGSLAVRSASR